MYSCELYSVRKSKKDFFELSEGIEFASTILRENDIDVRYRTEISADAVRIADSLKESLEDEDSDDINLFVFANALNTSDSSSFKKLFYEFIVRAESKLEVDHEHEGMTPKLKIFPMGDMGNGYRGYCFKYKGKLFVALPYASLVGKDVIDLIMEGVKKAQRIVDRNFNDYPNGIVFIGDSTSSAVSPKNPKDRSLDDKDKNKKKKPKKKEGFFKSFFPHRGDSKGSKVRKIIVLLALVVFIGALWYVLDFFVISPAKNNAINDEIREIAYNKDRTSPTTADGEPVPEQDWDALKDINDEIVGWIRLDDSRIDYPVMFHDGDDQYSQYYLNHTYKHEWSEYGTVFIDYRCPEGTKSKNVVMHGHNMIDGSMFGTLMKYSDRFEGDLDYYKDHSVFTFNTPDGDAKWKVISVFKTSTLFAHGEFFNYMQGEFSSPAEFMNFVYNVRIRSMFNVPVTINEDDQIMTLSTCSYEYTNFRTVLVARRVRPGEDPEVEVDLASVNDDPFLPEVCYSGSRPNPGTFKSAYQKGQINWYDGSYNGKDDKTLPGAETLTATVAANPTEPPTEKPKKGETQAPANRRVFTVTYTNMDGSQFAAYSVFEGDPVPVPDDHPTYEDENFYYNFVGWDRDVEGVDFEHLNTGLSIAPIFEATPK